MYCNLLFTTDTITLPIDCYLSLLTVTYHLLLTKTVTLLTLTDLLLTARGHHKKKKVHKAIKKIVIKFLIFLYVMQQAIRLFMYSAQTFILFKFMLIASVYVLTNVLKVWTLISWHHHEKHAPKVLYIEPKIKHVTQHHDIHSSPVHHEEYSPDGYEYEPSAHDSGLLWPRSDDAQRLAYYKQIPAHAQGAPQYTP